MPASERPFDVAWTSLPWLHGSRRSHYLLPSLSDGTIRMGSLVMRNCCVSDCLTRGWMCWTPATSGTAQISTCGNPATAYDTVLYARAGSCSGAQVACNDDTTGCATTTDTYHGSRLTFAVTAGQPYVIVVDGYNGRNGPFTLTVIPPP